MELATIIQDYLNRFKKRHGSTTTSDQWSALNAIRGCRTGQYGQILYACRPCAKTRMIDQSCGHRSCNQCQNHSTTQWLEKQTRKLLPVEYFMATFTLPAELRPLAKANQKKVYALLFECAVSTLKTFGLNDKKFAAELGMTAILHTHTRRLDYHPHVHIVVPGGGVYRKQKQKQWRETGEYLSNGYALAEVFKGKLLNALAQSGLKLPFTPKKWVVQCKSVGQGLPALQYLSRYLYRGVISNKNILSDDGISVTFEYIDSKSGETRTRTEHGEDFIKLVLQHTLPKGFRRARDYGFLHGNAKKLLQVVQWILKVSVVNPESEERERSGIVCKLCQSIMSIIRIDRPRPQPG